MTYNIIFPVLNEEKRLERGVMETYRFMEAHAEGPYALTIVDNGSTDRTRELATTLCNQHESIRYIRLDEKGVGIAVKTAIERNEMDIVGYMDIDLSTGLPYLEKAMEIFRSDPSVKMVNASRYGKESRLVGRKGYRVLTGGGCAVLLKFFLGMKATDGICGFKFWRKEVAAELIKACSHENGWFYIVEMLLRTERKGYKIAELPVVWVDDGANTTVHVKKQICVYLRNIRRLRKVFSAEDC